MALAEGLQRVSAAGGWLLSLRGKATAGENAKGELGYWEMEDLQRACVWGFQQEAKMKGLMICILFVLSATSPFP